MLTIAPKHNFPRKANTFFLVFKALNVINSAKVQDLTYQIDVKVTNLSILAPGPGNYRLPSEFGYYVSKEALQEVNRNVHH